VNPLPITDKTSHRKYFRGLLPFAILMSLPVPGLHAGTLGPASGYNVFTLSAYSTPGNTDIEGSVAVGGTLTATGSLSINEVPGTAAPSTSGLVVGGALSLAGGQLDNGNSGNAWVGGNVSSSSNFNFEQNLNYAGTLNAGNIEVEGTTTHISASSIPINFTTAATSLDQLSTTLEYTTANGTVATSGSNLTLTATGCTLCVFDLPTGNLSNNSIAINAPTGATVVINVPGTSDALSNGSITYTGGATASDTIFNFDAATTLTTTDMTVYGSILSPLAAFTGTNGSLDGELIAHSVSGQTAEFESGDIFSGNLGMVATPEPSSWILMSGALLACGLLRSRRIASARK
jgi:choice-of-anchor A domain-containing protein